MRHWSPNVLRFPNIEPYSTEFARKMAFLPSLVLSIYSSLRQRGTTSPESRVEMGYGDEATTSNPEQGGVEEGPLSGWFKFVDEGDDEGEESKL